MSNQAKTPVKRHPSLPNFGNILILMDEKLNKSKRALLQRLIVTFKQFSEVSVVPESSTEDAVLSHMREKEFDLVLLPWHHYRVWKRVEAFFGIQRTNGPTVAGYFCDPISSDLLGSSFDLNRFILLDFCNSNTKEICTLVTSLIQDKRRTGLIPLLRAGTKIYTENWVQSQGLGQRLDTIFNLPEVKNRDWMNQCTPIRSIILSLWSFIYEEGPGKSEFRQAFAGDNALACFQVGIDDQFFLFRLCYQSPGATPRSLMDRFWNVHESYSTATHMLMHFSDFVRAHIISATSEIEIVVGITKDKSSLIQTPQSLQSKPMRTLWIEPIDGELFQEIPFEVPDDVPNPNSPLRSLSKAAINTPGDMNRIREQEFQQEKALQHAQAKMRELYRLLEQRDQMISELKFGGVGNRSRAIMPDGDGLLAAFEQKFTELENEIVDIKSQLGSIDAAKNPEKIVEKSHKLERLLEMERRWVKQIGQMIQLYQSLQQPIPIKKRA